MPDSFLHYEIIDKLGEGGMGVVYLARDTKLNRNVALKFLPGHISRNSDERKRFRQEAQAAAALNHPNIAQVYAIEETGEELFISMEYVEGRDLKEVIEESGLRQEQKREIALQIGRGIKAAHDKGIVHRDIKSGNIMLDSEGNIKIMDFGLARVQGSAQITKTGTTIGTTAYMSPEQLASNDVDARSDIWSYGVVLYELFTGELPFQGAYEPAIMYSIAEEDPVSPSSIGQEISMQVEQVIGRCLEKDREYRYSDMGELLADLTGSEPVSVRTRPAKNRSSEYFKLADKAGYLYVGVPVVLTLLILALLLRSQLSWFGSGVPDKRYLAVLPIENIGNNPELQAICDGLAETFSYRLSELEKYEDSYWVAPASEMRKEKIASATQANRTFGVNLAVLSSIQVVEDSTRLILELVDADNIRRLGTEQIVVSSSNLAALERGGVRAMLEMLNIEINPRITETLEEGEPSEPEAYEYYLKGRAALQDFTTQENLDRAIPLFDRSIEIDPEFALGYAGLGEAYWRKYETTREPEFVDNARAALNRALVLNEELAPVQGLLGLLSAGTGELDEAIGHYNRAIEIDPKYSPAYRGLAKVYDEQGDTEQAVRTYRKAIELKPAYWEGYKDLGIHYLRKGDFENAISQFSRVVEITPKNSSAHSNLGVAYYYNGQTGRARQMFENSLALERNPLTANNLAGIYYGEGRYEEAASMYEIALEAYSNRYEIWGNLATAYELSGKEEEALRSYRTAIEKARDQLEVNPNSPQVLADLGAYYSDVNDTSNALRYINQALELNSENIMVRQRAVSTLENIGLRTEALSWIDASMLTDLESQPELKALVSDPRYAELKEKFEKENRQESGAGE